MKSGLGGMGASQVCAKRCMPPAGMESLPYSWLVLVLDLHLAWVPRSCACAMHKSCVGPSFLYTSLHAPLIKCVVSERRAQWAPILVIQLLSIL